MKTSTLIRVWAFAAAAVAASACGSVSNPAADAGGGSGFDAAPAGDFTLEVNPGTVSAGITDTVAVAVDVSRGTGFTDAVSLSVSDLPTGVTGAFDAASLPDGTTTTNLTLTIDATANAGTSTFTVTAMGGTRTHTDTVELTLTTATVTGKVRTGNAGATVRIVGKTAVQTDGTGNFTFTDVKVPYDIYVLSQSGPSNAPIPTVVYYKGLTRLDPVLTQTSTYCVGFCAFLFNNRSSTVTGTRGGSGTNAGPTYVKFTTTDGSETNTTGTWGFTASWYAAVGGQTINGRLQGLQAVRGTLGAPTGWLFAESAAQTLTHQGSLNINLTLAAHANTAALTGTITQPAAFPTPTVTLMQQLAGFPFDVWTATTTNAASTIPLLANQKASFHAISTSSGASTEGVMPGLSAATDVSMTLPPPAGITGPVNNATNITNATPFSFTTSANQVYRVNMESSTAVYVIHTTGGSLTIPMIEEMPLPPGTVFTWHVLGYGPLANIDAAADMTALSAVSKFEANGTFRSYTKTATRTFTTQ